MDSAAMTPRKLHAQSLYLEPERAAALDRLATESRIPKAVLLREAVDDLLTKHRIVWTRERAKDLPPRNIHRARLKPAKPK
jgi:hypothetical protein